MPVLTTYHSFEHESFQFPIITTYHSFEHESFGQKIKEREQFTLFFSSYSQFVDFIKEYVNRRNPEVIENIDLFIYQAWRKIVEDYELRWFFLGMHLLLVEENSPAQVPEVFRVSFPLHIWELEKICSRILWAENIFLPSDFLLHIKRIVDISFLTLKPETWEKIKKGEYWAFFRGFTKEDVAGRIPLEFVPAKKLLGTGGELWTERKSGMWGQRIGIPRRWTIVEREGMGFGDYEGRTGHLLFDAVPDYYALDIKIYAFPRKLEWTEMWLRYPLLIAKFVNAEVLHFLGEFELEKIERQSAVLELTEIIEGEKKRDIPSIFPLQINISK